MKTVALFLHPYVLNYLKSAGDIEVVINAIVNTVYCNGDYDFSEYVDVPPRDPTCKQVRVTIYNDEVCDLLDACGSNSRRFSIRRLLYWFIDNEIDYNMLAQSGKVNNIKKELSEIMSKIDHLISITHSDNLITIKGELEAYEKSI